MRFSILISISLLLFNSTSAQQTLTATTPMVSPQASISQTVGITKIEVIYSRPAVNDRKVWGEVVRLSPENDTNARPWRAGANENTTISFSTDAFVGGKTIKAGQYGLHLIIRSNGIVECKFSTNYQSWGSYYYDESEVVASVNTKWEDHAPTERLKYEFDSLTNESVQLSLNWGDKRIPIPIRVDVKATTLASLQQEIQNKHMINYMGPQEAAAWCLRNDTNLEQALGWANYSISFVKVFSNLKTKAEILKKTGKTEEAEKVMQEALSMGAVFEIHGYGRELIEQDKKDEALKIFLYNAKKHPNEWPVNYGVAKAYAAKADYKTAIQYLNKSIKNNKQERRQTFLAQKLEQLKKGEDIN